MITITDLYKSFGTQQVLNDLSITIPINKTIALLGMNGAGKSTLIKILSGLISFDEGSIHFDNIAYKQFFKKTNNKRKIGVVPQEIALYQSLTVKQNLVFWAQLYDLPNKEIKAKIEHYLQLLDLKTIERKKVNMLSIGQQKIVSLLAGILQDPIMLFLDEPTVGIDIIHKEKIYAFINDLKKKGITIVYTTHNFSEIPKICDEIAILKEGKIKDLGTEQALITKYKLDPTISISLEQKLQSDGVLNNFQNKGIDIFLEKEKLLLVQGQQANKMLPDILKFLNEKQITTTHLKVEQPSLEQIFFQAHN